MKIKQPMACRVKGNQKPKIFYVDTLFEFDFYLYSALKATYKSIKRMERHLVDIIYYTLVAHIKIIIF